MKDLKRYILYPLGVGFLLGIGVASIDAISFYSACVLGVIASAITFLLYRRGRNMLVLMCICVGVFSFMAGVLRYTNANEKYKIQEAYFIEKNIDAHGIISREPDIQEEKIRLVILLIDSPFKGSKVLTNVPSFMHYAYGDEVELKGTLELPENFTTDEGKEVDYKMILRKDGISYRMKYPVVTFISSGHGAEIADFFLSIKNVFIRSIALVLPEPKASLMSGMLVGATSSLGSNVIDEFRRTSLSHIVVLSGFNISLIAEVFMTLGLLYSRRASYISAMGAVVVFIGIAGVSSTVLRAGFMSFLLIVATMHGRRYQIGRALLFAGFIMVMINPYVLIYDISFQLSFMATLGVVYVAPLLEKKLGFISSRFGLRSLVALTLGAQLSVLPLIIFISGNISLLGLGANLLVVPLVPITMLIGFIMSVLSFIHPLVALPFSFVSYLLTSYILFVAHIISKIPYSVLHVSTLPGIYVFLIYLLGSIYVWLRWKKKMEEV